MAKLTILENQDAKRVNITGLGDIRVVLEQIDDSQESYPVSRNPFMNTSVMNKLSRFDAYIILNNNVSIKLPATQLVRVNDLLAEKFNDIYREINRF